MLKDKNVKTFFVIFGVIFFLYIGYLLYKKKKNDEIEVEFFDNLKDKILEKREKKCPGIKLYDEMNLEGKESILMPSEGDMEINNNLKSIDIPQTCVAEFKFSNKNNEIACPIQGNLPENWYGVDKIRARSILGFDKKCNPEEDILNGKDYDSEFGQYSITLNNKSCKESGYYPVMGKEDCEGAIKQFNRMLGTEGGQYSDVGNKIPPGYNFNTSNPNLGRNMYGVPKQTIGDSPLCAIKSLETSSGQQRFYKMNIDSNENTRVKKNKYQMICRTNPKPPFDDNKISPTLKGCDECPQGCDSNNPKACYNYGLEETLMDSEDVIIDDDDIIDDELYFKFQDQQ